MLAIIGTGGSGDSHGRLTSNVCRRRRRLCIVSVLVAAEVAGHCVKAREGRGRVKKRGFRTGKPFRGRRESRLAGWLAG